MPKSLERPSVNLALPAGVVAVAALSMSWKPDNYWQLLAGVAGASALLILIWNTFLAPRLRLRRLRKPVDAYFHIRSLATGKLGYVVQDDADHILKEIVLPPHALVDVELAYYPKISFNVEETVFECEGDMASKPVVEELTRPFVLKGDLPEVKTYTNRHGGFHMVSRYRGRSSGSCYTTGFTLKTKGPGVFKAWIGFLTDEVDGDAKDLIIRVEEKPLTRMRCCVHRLCFLRPYRHVG